MLADENGEVDMSLSSLSRMINFPKDLVGDCLETVIDVLMDPDPLSPFSGEDGRRILPIRPDQPTRWCGYKIANWESFYKAEREYRKKDQSRKSSEVYRQKQGSA